MAGRPWVSGKGPAFMSISVKAFRAVGLTSLLALSLLALGSKDALAACANGSTQWVRLGGQCCANNSQKYKGQSCLFGVWHDNGATQCSGPCAI
jgi:hypothetical protein